MKMVFAPGCALMLYKPHLADRAHAVLNETFGEMDRLTTCCRHEPSLTTKTEVINICPGCDKRFRNDYENTSTLSLWEILSRNDGFPFPDYHGKAMSIIDACPTRDQARIHRAVRTLLKKMNIALVEPKHTGTRSICCGDSFRGEIPADRVKKQMIKRTSEMPVDDVVVYCVSCSQSVSIGGKKPRYLVDLLFDEETSPMALDTEEWHRKLDNYIESH
jgi:Fe-S oxidoreductase